MTAVEFLVEKLNNNSWNYMTIRERKKIIQQAIEMEKQQKKQIVLNLLYHELGHDDTARWIAERLEAGKIDLNDL